MEQASEASRGRLWQGADNTRGKEEREPEGALTSLEREAENGDLLGVDGVELVAMRGASAPASVDTGVGIAGEQDDGIESRTKAECLRRPWRSTRIRR
eukprot:1713321-Rhodomonas_salina.1